MVNSERILLLFEKHLFYAHCYFEGERERDLLRKGVRDGLPPLIKQLFLVSCAESGKEIWRII